jgi:hypothetical protein
MLAVWKARSFEDFLFWGTAFFLAAQLLVFSQIWPWYAVWPLAFGALRPRSSLTVLAVLLSAGLAALYGLLGYCNTGLEWVYDYRSMFIVVLPVVVFAVMKVCGCLAGRIGEGKGVVK